MNMLKYQKNKHNITVGDPWFEYIKQGNKKYEGRRCTTSMSKIAINDILCITHHTNAKMEPIYVQVIDILKDKTFKDVIINNKLDLKEVLPDPKVSTIEDATNVYFKYVSLKTQEKDGVIMFKIKICT